MKLKVFLVLETAKLCFLTANVKGVSIPVPDVVDAIVHGIYDNIDAARVKRKRLAKKTGKDIKSFDVFPLEVNGAYVNNLDLLTKKLFNENLSLINRKQPEYYIQDENDKHKFIGVSGGVTIPSCGFVLNKIDPIAYQDDQAEQWSDDDLGFNHATD